MNNSQFVCSLQCITCNFDARSDSCKIQCVLFRPLIAIPSGGAGTGGFGLGGSTPASTGGLTLGGTAAAPTATLGGAGLGSTGSTGFALGGTTTASTGGLTLGATQATTTPKLTLGTPAASTLGKNSKQDNYISLLVYLCVFCRTSMNTSVRTLVE